MATQTQKVKVGVFLVLCLVLITVIIIIVSGAQHEVSDTYYIRFTESITGLSPSSGVAFRGVQVGRVEDIVVTDAGVIKATVSILRNKVKLFKGVEAQLKPQGITGLSFIDMSGGDPDWGTLPPGSTIPTKPSLIEGIAGALPMILSDIRSTLGKINAALGEEGLVPELASEMKALMGAARKTLETATVRIDEVGASATGSLDEAKNLFSVVNDKVESVNVEEIRDDVRKTLGNIRSISERFETTAAEINKTVPEFRQGMFNVEYELLRAIRELQQTLRSLQRLIDYVERDPSSLIRGKSLRGRTVDPAEK